jgi:DNA mismatch repair protein MutS
VAEEIGRAVAEGDDGRLIRPGYDAARDELVAAIADTRRWLAELESTERARTGIRSLKVGYNQVFGYYLEVTHPHRDRVPADYVRKQTLANAERYVTPQLKEAEARILHAEERIGAVERALFAVLLGRIGAQAARLLRTADALAHLDVYLALAEVADRSGYVCPEVQEGDELVIEAGRHPVVEAALGPEQFVANDCALGGEGPRIALLTGPNMAGKSTYLRQVALIVLLAQIGSFVPARRARLGLVDRIFTRIGAQDDLAAGASTFMVEMVETAAILRHATPRSLVVLDEIGRGTSTEDGLAIARAVVEHLHDRVGARALFATHYHELIALASELSRLQNLHTAVREDHGEVVFLHRVVPGAADRSYGLHVARLAGLPADVLVRATTLLTEGQSAAAPGSGNGPKDVHGTGARLMKGEGQNDLQTLTTHNAEPAPSGNGTAPAPAGGAEPEHAGRAVHANGRVNEPQAAFGASPAAPLGTEALVPLALALDDARTAPPGPAPMADGAVSGVAAPVAAATAHGGEQAVVEELLALDLCHVTPLQALNALARLQQQARDEPR